MSSTRARLVPLFLAALAACGSSSFENEDVRVRTAGFPASSAVLPVAGTTWFVYFADEALSGPTGSDLNGDGDTLDAVAVAARFGARTETLVPVAAQGAAVSGDDVWLRVDEAQDGRDWDGSGGTSGLVIVHWRRADGALAYVDTLDPLESRLFLVDERVYYASAAALGAGDETNLRYLERDAPTLPVPVANAPGAGAVRVRVLGEDEDLLFLVQDEIDAARDLDGDGDATDGFVLALLDGERKTSLLQNIGLALADADAPWNVRRRSDRWTVAVLVDEAAQGANLNDPALFAFPLLPDACAGGDADTGDQVLHFVEFPDFAADGGIGNTGLAGRDRVIVVDDYVATLADEADSGCDLNGDGDTDDAIVRWALVQAAGGVITSEPPRDPDRMVATGAVPGGARGLVELRERFVALVDEGADGRDRDGRAGDTLLVAWLDPEDPEPIGWTFAHQSSSNRRLGTGIFDSEGDSEPYVSPGWMSAEEREGRVALTFLESVPGANPLVASLNNNVDCTEVAKDDDLVDALPVWLDFESGPTLDCDGTGFAVPAALDVMVARGFAFFRVSELEDNRDWNGDQVLDDVVLVRNPLLSCDPELLDVVAPLPAPAIFWNEPLGRGAAFLSTGVDFDGDGDASELVVRHFSF